MTQPVDGGQLLPRASYDPPEDQAEGVQLLDPADASPAEAQVNVVVTADTQVHHDGATHQSGALLQVPATLAAIWQRNGYATTATKTSAKAGRKAT